MVFSNSVYLIWEISLAETIMSKQEFIEPEHLLMGICSIEKVFYLLESKQISIDSNTHKSIEREQHEIENIFSQLEISITSFRRLLRLNIEKGEVEEYENVIHRSEYSKDLFKKAEKLAIKDGLTEFRSIHLLKVILEEKIECIEKTLKLFNTSSEDFINILDEKKIATLRDPNSILERYGTDLTQLAREGKLDPIIGMDNELLQLVRTLNKREKNNALIIGEAGVGKSSLVRKLAQEIANRNLEGHINEKSIVEINMGSLVAGTKYRGEFEEKISSLLSEAKKDPNLILFIDEAHTIIGTGSNGSLDASNMIKSALASGELSIIGATTLEEYTLYFEKESAFERRFQPIVVNEPSPETVINILQNIKVKYEDFHNVIISDEAINAAVYLSVRYIIDRNLPDKALDVIDEACSRKVIPKLGLSDSTNTDNYVTEQDVKAVISDWRSIPVIDYSFAIEKLENMEDYLNSRIIGQEKAMNTISNRIKKALLGIQDINRPLAVFMFLGPRGVGKSYAVDALSDYLFDGSRSIIRLDMSEYSESHSISRLIGSPPGYKGNEEGGFLTNSIKNNPYSIVLIDNIEKAHPQVVDVLIQLFNYGMIVDAKNNEINGRQCIFIMTSNFAFNPGPSSPLIYGGVDEDNKIDLNEIIKYFRTDLVDVTDDFVLFKELDEDAFEVLVKKSLDALSKRVLSEKDIEIIFNEDACKLLAKKGYDKEHGVKYLNKFIERMVEFPFADMILKRKVNEGNKVIVSAKNNKLKFEVFKTQ